jgi:phospholipid/cholesterol/gamma-HCH transport system ATP-binding protein
MPPLPPVPLQLETSDGRPRRGEREPGSWCRDNGVVPPPGSFQPTDAQVPAGVATA